MNYRAIWDASECALILIDYQPEMFKHIKSSDPALVELNVRTLTRAARAFNIPIILSTVGVEMGVNSPTIEALTKEIPDVVAIDRSSTDAWEDSAFLKAVKATKKKRLVFCALYTEICLAYPVVEALREDYEVCFISDAVGGMSLVEHETAIARMVQAGAVPNTTAAMICEWFRDWKSPLAGKARELLVEYLPKKHQDFNQDFRH